MRTNSLAFRLFFWATGLTVVILIATGIALSSLYRHAVERAFDRRLDVYLRTLVADVASPEEGGEKFPQSIGEPLFQLPLAGWDSQATRFWKCRCRAGTGRCRGSTPRRRKCIPRARCGTQIYPSSPTNVRRAP